MGFYSTCNCPDKPEVVEVKPKLWATRDSKSNLSSVKLESFSGGVTSGDWSTGNRSVFHNQPLGLDFYSCISQTVPFRRKTDRTLFVDNFKSFKIDSIHFSLRINRKWDIGEEVGTIGSTLRYFMNVSEKCWFYHISTALHYIQEFTLILH